MNELFQWRVKAEILVQIEFDKLRIKVSFANNPSASNLRRFNEITNSCVSSQSRLQRAVTTKKLICYALVAGLKVCSKVADLSDFRTDGFLANYRSR